MEQADEMNTLSQILNKLKTKGMDRELKMSDHGKMQTEDGKIYCPEDLTIIKTYRFEGMSDPADNMVLYILETTDKRYAYLLDAYGAYSDNEGPAFDDFLKRINTENRDEQQLFN